MAIISVLAIIGLLSIIFGIWSVLYVNRYTKSEHASPSWKKFRTAVLLIGLIIGMLSWLGTGFMGYSTSFNGETIRVVGIPFIAAFLDSDGRDYVGPLTLLSVFGNGIFWFLLPQMFFAIHTKCRKTQFNIL